MTAPAAIEDVLALSPLQEGLFTLARLSGDAADPYVIQFVADINGPVDVALLQRSARAVLERHPNLRVSFWDRDVPRPVQIVPSRFEIPWEFRSAATADLVGIAEVQRRRHFDLGSGPSIRFLLVDVAPQRYRLICTAHHLIMDGWSVPVFVRELVAAYLSGGSLAALPAPRLYRDYIAWLAAQDRDRADAVWREHLDGLTAPTMLAARSAADARPDADPLPRKVELNLGRSDTAALLDWARANNLTVNTLAQFAWAVVLGRLTDRTDVVFGNTHSGRPDDLTGVESMVGLFINTIPLRVRLDDRPVGEQCRDLQRTSARLRAHGYVGLSAVQRHAGHGDLFDTLMVFQNAPRGTVEDIVRSPDGVEFVPVEMESLTHYPLVVVPFLYGNDLVLTIEYRSDLLGTLDPEATAKRILHVLRQIPAQADAAPRRLDVLLPGEGQRIIAAGTGPEATEPPALTVHGLFERHGAEAPAIGFAGRAPLSYGDVDRAANALAHRLLDAGLRAEDRVAIALPRTPEFVVAILAVAKAGGASLPIDVAAPRARAAVVVDRSGARFAVTTDEFAHLVAGTRALRYADGGAQRGDRPAVTVHPDQAAYVVFTSGSTGEPKGVVATHRGIATLLADHAARVYVPAVASLGRTLRVGHAWSLVFDASWQPTLALLDGHCVELFDADEQRDPDRLVAGIIDRKVDMIETSPSMFATLGTAGLVTTDPDGVQRCPLAVLGLGGEALGEATWNALRRLPDTRVLNFYGPTETTVDAVVADTADHARPAIGVPVAGMIALVLDSGLRPVPFDSFGELYLGGPQVTRGYIGRPGETASRFVPDVTGTGRRLYRTGDLVRRRGVDGALEYLGRSDDQVKIRGHRIELGEVEAAVAGLPGVQAAAVAVVRRAAGPALVGFAVTVQDPTRLRAQLTDRLPAYLVPMRIVAIDELPTTSNGKLDTRALVARGAAALAAGGSAGPRTDTERAIVDAVAGLLDGTTPGIDDDFGSLGVDSIVAIGVVMALRKADVGVTPRMVLTCPTIRELAAAIDAAVPQEQLPEADRYGEVPPLPIAAALLESGRVRRSAATNAVRLPRGIDPATLTARLQGVLDAHDILRAELAGARLRTRPPGVVSASAVLHRVSTDGDVDAAVRRHSLAALDRIDPAAGRMLDAVWLSDAGLLLLTVHHLAADAVSWQVMLTGLAAAPAGEITTYREFSRRMREYARQPEITAQREYWGGVLGVADPPLGRRLPDPATDTASLLRSRIVETDFAPGPSVRAGLLAALAVTLAGWRTERGQDPGSGAVVAVEGHGRADAVVGTDTSATVGWFTSVFPVRLGGLEIDHAAADPTAYATLVAEVAARLDDVPTEGVGFGLLAARYPELAVVPQVLFNYLGRGDLVGATTGDWSIAAEYALRERIPRVPDPDLPLRHSLSLTVGVIGTAARPRLLAEWRWHSGVFDAADLDRIAALWERAIGLAGAAP